MYQIDEKSLEDLENAFNLLNELTVSGIQNHSIIANIATLLQKFRANIVEIDNKIKTSNLPIKKEKEKINE